MKSKSDKQIIIEYLQQGFTLTALDAYNMWSILTSLRSRISDLRKDGYNITTEIVTKGDKSFAKYKLIKQPQQLKIF